MIIYRMLNCRRSLFTVAYTDKYQTANHSMCRNKDYDALSENRINRYKVHR